MARNIYRVRYERLPKSKSKVETNVYSEGHYREIDMVAESEEEAIAIADRVHAKQFSEAPEGLELGDEDVAVGIGGEPQGVEPINAHTNYKLQGVTILAKNV